MKNEAILKDVEKEIEECQKPEYFGKLTVSFNIQAGNIRNVNYTTERSKKYE